MFYKIRRQHGARLLASCLCFCLPLCLRLCLKIQDCLCPSFSLCMRVPRMASGVLKDENVNWGLVVGRTCRCF